MDKTLGYLLCCQSPALFLGALALLAGYIIRHRNHRVHAALDLVLAIVCLLGGVALYYLKPGQTDYTEAQKVYARVTAPGVYTFDLGGQWVTGLRIDPDSVGGVPTLFTGIDLNPPRPWYTRFVPTAGWWLVLAFVPAVAAAMTSAVCSFFIKKDS